MPESNDKKILEPEQKIKLLEKQKAFLEHRSDLGRGYFTWNYAPVNKKRNSDGSTSDGDLYYITSLLSASNRWGNNSGIDNYAEARTILDAMWEKDDSANIYNLINTKHKQITFAPEGRAGNFTDPSYHLPAFYEIRAQYANDGHEQFYRDCADTSRVFFHRACHPVTGLNSDYTNFDGSPHSTPWMSVGLRYDSWRVSMNIAMDYLVFVYKVQLLRCCSKSKSSYTLVYCGLNFSHALYLNFRIQTPDFIDRDYLWSGKDKKWQQEYSLKFQQFLRSKGISTYKDQFNPDGSEPEFILQAGGFQKLRHSLGLLYLFSLLHLSGKYQIINLSSIKISELKFQ